MAKSTCNPDTDVPKGMKRFEVIRSTVKDCLGQYCVPGDMAVLNKDLAQGYLDKNFIRVALPDFDEPEDETDGKSATKDASEERKDEGGAANSAPKDAPKRSTSSRDPRKSLRKRSPRDTS